MIQQKVRKSLRTVGRVCSLCPKEAQKWTLKALATLPVTVLVSLRPRISSAMHGSYKGWVDHIYSIFLVPHEAVCPILMDRPRQRTIWNQALL